MYGCFVFVSSDLILRWLLQSLEGKPGDCAKHCPRDGKRDEDEIEDGVLFRLEKVKMGPVPFFMEVSERCSF